MTVPFEVVSRRTSAATIAARWPGAAVLDVTSRGCEPWVRLSPFFPHGGIPVPMTPGMTGQSVEGIWQALEVFENADVDSGKLGVTSMKGIKRGTARYGRVLGHRAGLGGAALLPYLDARRQIYLPAYRWVLENRVADLVDELRAGGRGGVVVLLDYNTNGDVADLSRPLSHAALAARYAEGDWPRER